MLLSDPGHPESFSVVFDGIVMLKCYFMRQNYAVTPISPVELPPDARDWAGGAGGQAPAPVAAGHGVVVAGLGREGDLPGRHLLYRGQEGLGRVHLVF